MQQRLAEPVLDTTEPLTLAERLRQLRKATGCTTGEIAAAAGLFGWELDFLETDRVHHKDSDIEALARVYGVTSGYLLTGEKP